MTLGRAGGILVAASVGCPGGIFGPVDNKTDLATIGEAKDVHHSSVACRMGTALTINSFLL